MESTEWSTPALLRHARATYANAMRQALEEAGYGDLPSNGLYVIGALAQGGDEVALGEGLVAELVHALQAAELGDAVQLACRPLGHCFRIRQLLNL